MPYPHSPHTNCKYCEAMISLDKLECDSCSEKKATIKVVEGLYDDFVTTFGDYDLDCKVGLGETEEDAIDDLMGKRM